MLYYNKKYFSLRRFIGAGINHFSDIKNNRQKINRIYLEMENYKNKN